MRPRLSEREARAGPSQRETCAWPASLCGDARPRGRRETRVEGARKGTSHALGELDFKRRTRHVTTQCRLVWVKKTLLLSPKRDISPSFEPDIPYPDSHSRK